MKQRNLVLATTALVVILSSSAQARPPINLLDLVHPVYAETGMVASQEAIASTIGADILREGGNAVDAAVAVGFALAVTLPQAGNLGGGGFMVIHSEDSGKDTAIDFREMAPQAAHRDLFLDASGEVDKTKARFSYASAGVPGSVAGLALAAKNYGTLPLADLIKPAIKLAERGFVVSEALADSLERSRERLGKSPASMAAYFKADGSAYQTGDILKLPDLAASLEAIAEKGPSAFYEGAIAEKIAADMAANDGLITLEDLKNYRAVEREPVRGRYRGHEVISMPPPSSGGVHLVQILNILERYPLADFGHNSAATIHFMAESMRLAYADRSEYLGDPDFTQVPIAGLTSKSYADSLAQTINADAARPSSEVKPGKPPGYESDQTTHYSVIDGHGNVVSTTYTLNFSFGSGHTVAGTGILLNNEMDDFSSKPGVPNAYGLIGGEANAIEPAKRPLSSMTPTIVLKDGRPWLATGSPGGSRIITTTLQIISNMVDHGMNAAEATIAPRIHHQWLPDELRVESGISKDTLDKLTDMGHTVVEKNSMGSTQTIAKEDDGLYGYSDPRRNDGLAVGY